MPPKSLSTFLHLCCSLWLQTVCHFHGSSARTAVHPSEMLLAHPLIPVDRPAIHQNVLPSHNSSPWSCKIRKRCILSPKNVRQVLLRNFEYSLSYKNDFGTKNIFLFSNKKWIYYCMWNIYNSFSRSSKIMRLVLLAFFEHVLPRKYLCDHLVAFMHLSISFMSHIVAQH